MQIIGRFTSGFGCNNDFVQTKDIGFRQVGFVCDSFMSEGTKWSAKVKSKTIL